MNLLWKPLYRVLNNPSLVALLLFAASLGLGFYFIGQWMMPVIISVAIAYLLDGIIFQLTKWKLRRNFAFYLVYFAFITLLAYIIIGLIPIVLTQAKSLFSHLPSYLIEIQDKFKVLPQKFPQFISYQDVDNLLQTISSFLSDYSKQFFSGGIFSSLKLLITLAIYTILIPILIFFMLKDKATILDYLGRFLPENKQIIKEIWQEVDMQIGNYIRGKFAEIMIIWLMSFIAFYFLNLQYSLLLSLMVGLSVLIPYIGATLVTIPVLVLAYMQFGISSSFWWITIVYFVIQILDGNVIVPLIFSEAVDIHPVAIIIAVLIFGGLWGFWGVFFAIPLATVVKAVVEAWRRYQDREHLEDNISL